LGRPRMGGWHSNWSMLKTMDGNYSPSHHHIQIHQDWLDINRNWMILPGLNHQLNQLTIFLVHNIMTGWDSVNDHGCDVPSWESIQATGGTKHF
jgi:hypothetical protein